MARAQCGGIFSWLSWFSSDPPDSNADAGASARSSSGVVNPPTTPTALPPAIPHQRAPAALSTVHNPSTQDTSGLLINALQSPLPTVMAAAAGRSTEAVSKSPNLDRHPAPAVLPPATQLNPASTTSAMRIHPSAAQRAATERSSLDGSEQKRSWTEVRPSSITNPGALRGLDLHSHTHARGGIGGITVPDSPLWGGQDRSSSSPKLGPHDIFFSVLVTSHRVRDRKHVACSRLLLDLALMASVLWSYSVVALCRSIRSRTPTCLCRFRVCSAHRVTWTHPMGQTRRCWAPVLRTLE